MDSHTTDANPLNEWPRGLILASSSSSSPSSSSLTIPPPPIPSCTSDIHKHNPNSPDDLCPSCITYFAQLIDNPLRSPVSHLVSSGQPLSSSSSSSPQTTGINDESLVRSTISLAERRILALDAAEQQVLHLLSRIRASRQQTVDFADEHKVLVAPVWELPPEILSYIFLLYVSCNSRASGIKESQWTGGRTSGIGVRGGSTSSTSASTTTASASSSSRTIVSIRTSLKNALLVSSVNAHWRRVALSTPQLWSVLILDNKSFPPNPQASNQQPPDSSTPPPPLPPSSPSTATPANDDAIPMPQICLARSGACSLQVYLKTDQHNTPMIDFITPLAPRWKKVCFDMPVSMLKHLESKLKGKVPLLRSVELKGMYWFDRADATSSSSPPPLPLQQQPNPLHLFRQAANLRRFISCVPFQESFLSLPLSQLTRWDGPTRLADFKYVLLHAPRLKEAFFEPVRGTGSVSGSVVEDAVSATSPTLIPGVRNTNIIYNTRTHENLTTLHISTTSYTSFTFNLSHLPPLPSLLNLFIYIDKRVLVPSTPTSPNVTTTNPATPIDGHSCTTHLIYFFKRAARNLEHLVFGISTSPGVVMRCLKECKQVKTIQIHRLPMGGGGTGSGGTDEGSVLSGLEGRTWGEVKSKVRVGDNGVPRDPAANANITASGITTGSGGVVADNEVGEDDDEEDDDELFLPELEVLKVSGKVYFSARAVMRVIQARWQDPEKADADAESTNIDVGDAEGAAEAPASSSTTDPHGPTSTPTNPASASALEHDMSSRTPRSNSSPESDKATSPSNSASDASGSGLSSVTVDAPPPAESNALIPAPEDVGVSESESLDPDSTPTLTSNLALPLTTLPTTDSPSSTATPSALTLPSPSTLEIAPIIPSPNPDLLAVDASNATLPFPSVHSTDEPGLINLSFVDTTPDIDERHTTETLIPLSMDRSPTPISPSTAIHTHTVPTPDSTTSTSALKSSLSGLPSQSTKFDSISGELQKHSELDAQEGAVSVLDEDIKTEDGGVSTLSHPSSPPAPSPRRAEDCIQLALFDWCAQDNQATPSSSLLPPSSSTPTPVPCSSSSACSWSSPSSYPSSHTPSSQGCYLPSSSSSSSLFHSPSSQLSSSLSSPPTSNHDGPGTPHPSSISTSAQASPLAEPSTAMVATTSRTTSAPKDPTTIPLPPSRPCTPLDSQLPDPQSTLSLVGPIDSPPIPSNSTSSSPLHPSASDSTLSSSSSPPLPPSTPWPKQRNPTPRLPSNLKAVYIYPPRHDKFDPDERTRLLAYNDRGLVVEIKQLDRIAFLDHQKWYL